MSKTFTQPIDLRHDDPALDRQLRNVDARIREVVAVPAMAGLIIPGVEVTPGVDTIVHHGQHRPVSVFISAPKGALVVAGVVYEVELDSVDSDNSIVLRSVGFVGSLTVDLWVL